MVATHHIKVIHITSIVTAMEYSFYKLVKLIEKHIAEQLRSEISYRQPSVGSSITIFSVR